MSRTFSLLMTIACAAMLVGCTAIQTPDAPATRTRVDLIKGNRSVDSIVECRTDGTASMAIKLTGLEPNQQVSVYQGDDPAAGGGIEVADANGTITTSPQSVPKGGKLSVKLEDGWRASYTNSCK